MQDDNLVMEKVEEILGDKTTVGRVSGISGGQLAVGIPEWRADLWGQIFDFILTNAEDCDVR